MVPKGLEERSPSTGDDDVPAVDAQANLRTGGRAVQIGIAQVRLS